MKFSDILAWIKRRYVPSAYAPFFMFFFGILFTLETIYFVVTLIDEEKQGITIEEVQDMQSPRTQLITTILISGLLSSLIFYIISRMQVTARTFAEESELQLRTSQEALQASEERFRLLIESVKDFAIITMDKNGKIVSWNAGAQNLFGYSEEEILLRNFKVFFTKEDRENNLPEKELRRVLATSRSEDENWLVRKDGSHFWASGVTTAMHDANGKLKGMAKVTRDITLRKVTEEALRRNEAMNQAILQSLPAYILVVDKKGKIIALNEAWTKQASEPDAAKVQMGKNYFDLLDSFESIAKADKRVIIQGIKAVAKNRKSDFQLEYQLLPLETERWFSIQVLPLKYTDSGVVISNREVTDRKKLEQQKDEFISIASHELKTPITSLKAYTQVLLTGTQAKEKSQKLLQRMEMQIDKLTGLVSDLLDISKIEAGRLQFTYEKFAFDDLVNEVVETLQLTTSSHDIKQKGKSGIEVYGDRERLSQVLINLISNAVKYSPGADKVIVTTKVHKRENTVGVSVQDFGVGIPKVQQARIFERFYRVGANKGFPGLGLGLYISAEIIKRLNGKIWVESKKGEGATFSFTVPIAK